MRADFVHGHDLGRLIDREPHAVRLRQADGAPRLALVVVLEVGVADFGRRLARMDAAITNRSTPRVVGRTAGPREVGGWGRTKVVDGPRHGATRHAVTWGVGAKICEWAW